MALPRSAVCISAPVAGRECSCIPPAGSAEQGSSSPLSVFPGWKKTALCTESMFHSVKKSQTKVRYWKETVNANRKLQKANKKMGIEPQVDPCGIALGIKGVGWQECESTAYVEITPCRYNSSYLLPANKHSWHSHSSW